MRLKNKKTGEIIDDGYVRETHDFQFDGQKHVLAVFKGNGHRPPERVSGAYKSLAELNEEWEDAPEEPSEIYFISNNGQIHEEDGHDKYREKRKEIGNYFSSREEAELAVEKLKAWRRLKGGGFEFMSCSYGHDKTTDDTGGWIRFRVNHLYDDRYSCEVEKDLDLLFCSEENS